METGGCLSNTSDAEDEEVEGCSAISATLLFILTAALMLNYHITSSAEFLWCSFSSGHRDKSCSHHFVLNLPSQASVSIEFAPDCSWIVQCFCAVTFLSCSSVVSLIIKQISLSQSSSVRTNPDNVLVVVAVSAFRM
ncbi:conserved hypothetical protein [Trichinella spiralis]|uniref:hypothetical protein n=1 Tax=Trichinella spiralis TaxID=6334 RepID=UPI0001EFE0E6|nr:conserved hypothetical protein [Trichinella spiralis]